MVHIENIPGEAGLLLALLHPASAGEIDYDAGRRVLRA